VLREPVQVFVKIPPTMLGQPVRRIDVGKPTMFIAFNSSEEMVVTTVGGNEVLTFDKSGKKLRSFKNKQLIDPTGVAVDGPNVYVADFDDNALLKLDNTGKLLKSVGQNGSGEGEFSKPFGMTVVGDEVIVCDRDNHRLQVFTSDLVFVRQFGSRGEGNGQFSHPWDVTHDEDGNLYVADGRNCVQVFNINGKFLRIVVAPGCITDPTGITYHHGLVCVSQRKDNGTLYVCRKNGEEGCSIQCDNRKGGVATDQDGFIYVCDFDRNEVVVI
jgi:DNA-binding beta-propeller fold protein YncE